MKKVLLIFILSFLFLVGCQKNVNEIGLTEINADEYINYIGDSIITYDSLENVNFDIELKYPNNKIAYSINTPFGYVVYNGNEYHNINILYSETNNNTIKWKIYNDYLLTDILFMDILIMEDEVVIGFALLKFEINRENKTVELNILKSVLFKEVLNNERIVHVNIIDTYIKTIIKENSEKINLKSSNTREFISKYSGSLSRDNSSVVLMIDVNKKSEYYKHGICYELYIENGSFFNEYYSQKMSIIDEYELNQITIYFLDDITESEIYQSKLIVLFKEKDVTIGFFVGTIEGLCIHNNLYIFTYQEMFDNYNGVIPIYSDDKIFEYINELFVN